MKKLSVMLICVIILISCCACSGMSVSTARYEKVSKHVLENADAISVEKEIEFFEYEATGLGIGGVYYGYYYTANNEVIVPDFYSGDNIGERYEANDGVYFGKPNNGTDWCYIKAITDNWYYYELHWG